MDVSLDLLEAPGGYGLLAAVAILLASGGTSGEGGRRQGRFRMRPSGRQLSEMRPISIETEVTRHAEGACLIRCGHTHVLCTATVEERVPPWLRNTGLGWVTAEYGMLPRATHSRMQREAKRGQSG